MRLRTTCKEENEITEKITLELTREEAKMLNAACSIANLHYEQRATELHSFPLDDQDEKDCNLVWKFIEKAVAYYDLKCTLEKQMEQAR